MNRYKYCDNYIRPYLGREWLYESFYKGQRFKLRRGCALPIQFPKEITLVGYENAPIFVTQEDDDRERHTYPQFTVMDEVTGKENKIHALYISGDQYYEPL